MIAKALVDLPEKYGCRLCGGDKPIAQMVLVRRRRTKDFVLRPRCKDCNNQRERGHRREYKRNYLRNWRKSNRELNDSYWKPRRAELRPIARLRAAIRRADPLTHAAQLIQGRLRRRVGKRVTISEAKKLCLKYGPCYPTQFGLTQAGLRECERIRSRMRRTGKPLKTADIRLLVYEDWSGDEGKFVITPSRQKMPYQNAAAKLRKWHEDQRRKKAA